MLENTVITIKRRQQLALITSGAVDRIAPVSMVAFGNGGADIDGRPIPPLTNATDLTNELGRYSLDRISYPLDPAPRTTTRYVATIPPDDLAGADINEAALVDSDGDVCAIKTMFSKRKDRGVTFTFTFDDVF